jgi:hypothetical protein
MFLTWLKTALLCLALVAGGLGVGHAPALAGQPPGAAHRAVLASHAADDAFDIVASPAHAGHHHRSDGPGHGCPTAGQCCDAFCHAVLAAEEPSADALRVSFAAYERRDDAAEPSLAVRGPERPPRSDRA